MKFENLKNKKICVLGFGREGQATVDFLLSKRISKNKNICICDERFPSQFEKKEQKLIKSLEKSGIVFFLGELWRDGVRISEVIIKSPGFLISKISNLKRAKEITSQTELFFSNFPGKIVGITGTKGKSTTSALIYHILKSNKNVKLAGNIGIPMFSILPKANSKTIAILELSCHQLDGLKLSPQISVFLNIFPEHLDFYKDFQSYFNAKSSIALNQKKSDFFIYNSAFNEIVNLAEKTDAQKIDFTKFKIEEIIGQEKIKLDLSVYTDNIKAAFAVAQILKVKETAFIKALKSFQPLPHRLEFVGRYKQIYFYDDSLATVPQATIAAIKSFNGKVNSIILGGHDRNINNYDQLAQTIIENKIENIAFFPSSGKKMALAISEYCEKNKAKLPHYYFASNMSEAVDFCFRMTKPDTVCLLSCAAPSFGLFKDYKDRGEQFIKFIKNKK